MVAVISRRIVGNTKLDVTWACVLQFFEITSQRLLDQSHVGSYIGENATYPPFWAFWGLFAYPTPRG